MGRVVDVRTTDGEELEAASVGWDVRYAQLGNGRCDCRHLGVHTARLQLCLEAWSLGMLKRGRAPRGSVTFLVPLGQSGAPRIQGRPVAAGDVVVLFDGDEFDYRSAGPARLVSVSIERAALEGRVSSLLGRQLGELRLQGRLSGLRTDPGLLGRLCHQVAARAAADPGLLRDAASLSRLEGKSREGPPVAVRDSAGTTDHRHQPQAGLASRGLAPAESRRAAEDSRPLQGAQRPRAYAPRGVP